MFLYTVYGLIYSLSKVLARPVYLFKILTKDKAILRQLAKRQLAIVMRPTIWELINV